MKLSDRTHSAENQEWTEATELIERIQRIEWKGITELPIPPQGVIEFSRLAGKTDACIQALSSIVESEPGLTVELLKSVNSSVFGIRARVDSVPRAIAQLGIATCSSIFLTKALDRALKFVESPLLPQSDIRRESLERARFAREIAIRLGLDPILSFTASSLQDVLLPLLTRQHPNEYSRYLSLLDHVGIEEFERETFGWTHAEITAKVLVDWGFPDSLVLRVLLHHSPPEELFLSGGFRYETIPVACGSLLNDVLHQAPSGVPRLIELQRFHPGLKVLSIADTVDKQQSTTGAGTQSGMPLVNRIQCAMLEQLERSRSESIIPGRQFGNYVIEKKLTESSMGAIFKAKHIMLRRQTAIKFLRADKITRESIRQFEREVQLTSTLSHPNTISIFDFGRTSDDLFYYAMEYIDGPTLSELVERDGPCPDGRVLSFLLQILGSLAEAHSHRLVHRDIKPQNIMLSEGIGYGDRITVLDFGLVTESQIRSASTPVIRGTPLYMSPEAALCRETIDERSDLYSVGAVAYFLLTGKPMFEGSTSEVLAHHIHTTPRPPSGRTSNLITPALEQFVMMCLRKEPADRPESAGKAVDILMDCQVLQPWSMQDCRTWWKNYSSRSTHSAPNEDRTPDACAISPGSDDCGDTVIGLACGIENVQTRRR